MPVRFVCDICNSRLTVSRRFAGQQGRCPNCKQRVKVPEINIETPATVSAAGFTEPYPDFRTDPFVEIQDDGDNEHPIETRDNPGPGTSTGVSKFAETIPIARWIVYMQAALLGIVATSFFVFGLAVGSNTGPQPAEQATDSESVIRGVVVFRNNGNEEVDTGAVVLLLPAGNHPDPRPEPDSLVPDRFVPLENPAIETIRKLGGAVVRVDRIGGFHARLRSGSYWLLVLSRHQAVDKQVLEKQMRADLGDYFFPVENLIGRQAYHWQKIRLTGGDLELPKITF